MPKGRPRVSGTADRIVGPLRPAPPLYLGAADVAQHGDGRMWSAARMAAARYRLTTSAAGPPSNGSAIVIALSALAGNALIAPSHRLLLDIRIHHMHGKRSASARNGPHQDDEARGPWDMERHVDCPGWLGSSRCSALMYSCPQLHDAPTREPHRSPWCLAARPPARTKQTAISAGVCGAGTRGGASKRASFCSLLIMSDSRMKAIDECRPAIAGEQNAAWWGKRNWEF
ncbi:hypothetical protein BJ912DRAFT_1068053 [Pholiota molesta]|nr:hypothetical protein BJ912DRAFT_1068053 [Pholiota molesta]